MRELDIRSFGIGITSLVLATIVTSLPLALYVCKISLNMAKIRLYMWQISLKLAEVVVNFPAILVQCTLCLYFNTL